MKSYRFARRAFLAGVGGALGFRTLLSNLEASAQGMTSPPRFLVTHWPVGAIEYFFLPQQFLTGSRPSGAQPLPTPLSRILAPFEPLRNDMSVIWGLSRNGLTVSGGGGHEQGTVIMVTGVRPPGIRSGAETDDAFAGGPSFDQIFMRLQPNLQRPKGSVNSICDGRTDVLEISTQCLSYGDAKEPVPLSGGGTGMQNSPRLPQISPLQQYMNLFGTFMGTPNPTPNDMEAMKKALRLRKSVLDFSLREMARIKTLAPSSEWQKIDIHTDAIRKIEMDISAQLAGGGPSVPTGCMAPANPGNQQGQARATANDIRRDYSNPNAAAADDMLHETVGNLHMGIIRAAFQCDIIRVATFQWSPGTNHVSFAGQHPDYPTRTYMHHPLSHHITNQGWSKGNDPNVVPTGGTGTGMNATTYRGDMQFLANVHTWYNQRMATILQTFKTATDAYGGSLLDYTVIPYITEIAETGHSHSNFPAIIFGGTRLGMRHNQIVMMNNRAQNDFWLTVAQPFFPTSTNVLDAVRGETFAAANVTGPIAGLWQRPA